MGLMQMLGLNEATDQLTVANSVNKYEYVLRGEHGNLWPHSVSFCQFVCLSATAIHRFQLINLGK